MLGVRAARVVLATALVVALGTPSLRGQDTPEAQLPGMVVPSLPSGSGNGSGGSRSATVEVPAVIDAPTVPVAPNCPPPTLLVPDEAPFVPYMLGDFIGTLANPMTDLKVGEGESPRPLDRVFYRFNMYSNLNPNRYESVSTPYKRVNLYANTFGFEKTFGDWFSFGLRLPLNGVEALSRGTYYPSRPGGLPPVATPAPPDYNAMIFGNINAIVKIRLIDDRSRGNLLSTGFSLSFPTATNQTIDPGPSTAAVFQPFLGYIVARQRFFFQGFSSITMPMVSVQSMIWFQDLGLGVWAYRNDSPTALLTGIAPTFEMHLNVPLQGPNRAAWMFERASLPFNTQFNLTFGTTFEFAHRATLALGLVVPTVGPVPFDCEFQAQFNVRF